MLNEDAFRVLIMEEQYPILSDEQIEYFCTTFTNINQAAYLACMMKAKSDTIKVGPIEIQNDAAYWKGLAEMFFTLWKSGEGDVTGIKSSRSRTGRCIGRADEF